jgi:hypothetical protein
MMLHIICNIHQNAAIAPERENGPNKPKVVEALHPFKLHPDHTPNDLQAFFTTSQMELYTIAEQQVFFFSCVTVPLETKIRENDLYAAYLAVLSNQGADCLQAILEAEFMLCYPLFNRCLNFF